MPLSFAPVGEARPIIKLSGNDKTRRHLSDLGFIVGEPVMVISSMGGNLIVSVKGTRLAISIDMANKVIV